MSEGKLIVLSGPSGAGKGTLVERVLEQVPNIRLSISATTRSPREGEVDGIHYRFMTTEEFEKAIEEDGFIEWANVHGNYYGTPIGPIREHMDAGSPVLLEIDVQGAFQVREKFPQSQLVFVAPPSIEELEARLRGRGTESEEAIVRRMENAKGEMALADSYDLIIVNDDLITATNELAEVLKS